MFKKILIGLLVTGLIFVVIGFILFKGNLSEIFASFNKTSDYTYVEKIGNENLTEVDFDFENANIIIKKHNETTYKISYYEASYDVKTVKEIDGKLEITQDVSVWENIFSIKFTSSKVVNVLVYLPSSFTGQVNVQSISGNVEIKDFTLNEVNINLTSGRISLNNLSVNGNLDLLTNSGNIILNEVKADLLNAKVNSGKIILNDIEINNSTTLKTTTGNIEIDDLETMDLTVNSVSGKVLATDLTATKISVNITSGNIILELEGSKYDYKIDAKSVSGNIYYLGEKMGKSLNVINGLYEMKLNSTSGNISINFDN